MGAVAATLGAAPGAAADVTWQPAQVIDPVTGSGEVFAELGAARGGAALMGWVFGGGQGAQIGAAFAPPGQPFGPTQHLASEPQGSAVVGGFATAVDERGEGVVVWEVATPPAQAVLRAAVRHPDGTFGAPHDVFVDDHALSFGFDATMLPDGTAVVVYDDPRGNPPDSSDGVFAIAKPPGGDWGNREQLAGASTIEALPRVAADPRGNAIAAWSHSEQPAQPLPHGRVQAAERPASSHTFRVARPGTT